MPVVEYRANFLIESINNGETNVSFISNAFAQGTAAGGIESSLMSFLPLILMFVRAVLPHDPPANEAPEGTRNHARRAWPRATKW